MEVDGEWNIQAGMETFTDGSGGFHTADPRVRRCGSAAVLCSGCDAVASMNFSTPGPRQTTPRAELEALVVLVEKHSDAIRRHSVNIITDCMYVVNGVMARHANLRSKHRRKGTNTDLWARLLVATGAGSQYLDLSRHIRKVSSHLKQQHVDANIISPEWLYGNNCADALARKAADRHEVEASIITKIHGADEKAKIISGHLARTALTALEANVDGAPVRPPTGKARGRKPKAWLPHPSLSIHRGRVTCSVCWASCPENAPGGLAAAASCLPPEPAAAPCPEEADLQHQRQDSDQDPMGYGGDLSSSQEGEPPPDNFDLERELDQLSTDDDAPPPPGPAPMPAVQQRKGGLPPDAPRNVDGPCWAEGCRNDVVEQCEVPSCPRAACFRHGASYLEYHPVFLSTYVCEPCEEGIKQGQVDPNPPAANPHHDERHQPASSSADCPQHVRAVDPDARRHPLEHVPFHHTHALGYKRGYAWCWRCGAYTDGTRPRDIKSECNIVPASAAGRNVKRRVTAGLPPSRPRTRPCLPK